jgi:hypothetical protein
LFPGNKVLFSQRGAEEPAPSRSARASGRRKGSFPPNRGERFSISGRIVVPMKTISKEVPTFGKVWDKINTTSHDGFCRAHRGEFSIWAAFLLVVGAIVRWLPGLRV